MDVDAALTSLGKFGRWQMLKYTMVCLSVTVSGCWHMMVGVFTGDEPSHHCKVPEGQTLNETIPTEIVLGIEGFSRCQKYANLSVSNATIDCDDGWHYATTEGETTIVTQWDLVCEKNYLAETSQSVFNFGVMVGAIVFTTMADKIGRKVVHLGCQYAMVVVGLAIAFSPNYITFVVLRFLLGAIREGAGLVGIVMACELFPASQRTFAGTALELFWAAAWMMLTLLAYLVRDWRHLQIAVSVPPVITILLIWFLPESIPWLAANGRVEDAKSILKDAAKFNGVQIPAHILQEDKTPDDSASDMKLLPNPGTEPHTGNDVQENSIKLTAVETTCANCDGEENSDTALDVKLNDKDYKSIKPLIIEDNDVNLNSRAKNCYGDQRKLKHYLCACAKKRSAQRLEDARDVNERRIQYTCLDILKSRTMVLYTFIMCSVWFASGVIYFGLSLSTSTMPGGKYINFFLSGAVEAPAYAMTVVVLQKFGRRWPLFIFHMVAAVVLFINVWLPNVTESGVNLVPLVVTLTNVGKFSMTAAFGTVVLYAPEIYPTNLRNLGFGLASVWGRIGGMIAPFAVYIGKIVPWIPGLVFSIIAVVTGAGVFFLPETLNRPLPDTIEEIESWKRDGGYKRDKCACPIGSPKQLKVSLAQNKDSSTAQSETHL